MRELLCQTAEIQKHQKYLSSSRKAGHPEPSVLSAVLTYSSQHLRELNAVATLNWQIRKLKPKMKGLIQDHPGEVKLWTLAAWVKIISILLGCHSRVVLNIQFALASPTNQGKMPRLPTPLKCFFSDFLGTKFPLSNLPNSLLSKMQVMPRSSPNQRDLKLALITRPMMVCCDLNNEYSETGSKTWGNHH